MSHLDFKISVTPQDVAARLFETFREEIRDNIREYPHFVPHDIYMFTCVRSEKDENYLWNSVEAFRSLSPLFHKELKEHILRYIEEEYNHVSE